MIFNSIPFFCFFFILFLLYWLVFNKNLKTQNILLLLSCYVFYGWMEWRFLAYLISASFIGYYFAIGINNERNEPRKKIILQASLFLIIGGLVFIKYYNFLAESISQLFKWSNFHWQINTLKLLIPLGISFFTFRLISYLLDVYHEKIEPSKNIIVFLNYVAFFPSVISGPIDKAQLLIPQLSTKREFSYELAADGLRQILWGLFKKIVIADYANPFVTEIFSHYKTLPSSTVLIGAFLYFIQMYTDFSGYSDMAIGIAKLLGFKITKNFNYPIFAQNIADYWRRWHMSLTSWLTEYVFTPLSIAFRNWDKWGLGLAIVLNFVICGVWHGANWTYVLFGLLHGCYFIPLIYKGSMNKKSKLAVGKSYPSFNEVKNIFFTISIAALTLVVFRADTIADAFGIYKKIFSIALFSMPTGIAVENYTLSILLLNITLMYVIEWRGREWNYGIEQIHLKWSKAIRWGFYYLILIDICLNYYSQSDTFIYFKF